MKSGHAIVSPVDGSRILPNEFIVFDAPLGRAHFDTGRFIDFMVFVDTPLDVAMARRLLRDVLNESGSAPEDAINSVKDNLARYLHRGRTIYLAFERQVKQQSDLILDGCLCVDEIATAIYRTIQSRI